MKIKINRKKNSVVQNHKQGLYCTYSSSDIYLTECLVGIGRVTQLQILKVFRDCFIYFISKSKSHLQN